MCEIFDVFVATELSEISVDVQQSLDVSTATDEQGKCLEALIRPREGESDRQVVSPHRPQYETERPNQTHCRTAGLT